MAFSLVGQNVLRIFRGESLHKDNRPRKYKCQQLLEKEFELKRKCRVVRIWHFDCHLPGSIPGWETDILQDMQCGQNGKNKIK